MAQSHSAIWSAAAPVLGAFCRAGPCPRPRTACGELTRARGRQRRGRRAGGGHGRRPLGRHRLDRLPVLPGHARRGAPCAAAQRPAAFARRLFHAAKALPTCWGTGPRCLLPRRTALPTLGHPALPRVTAARRSPATRQPLGEAPKPTSLPCGPRLAAGARPSRAAACRPGRRPRPAARPERGARARRCARCCW